MPPLVPGGQRVVMNGDSTEGAADGEVRDGVAFIQARRRLFASAPQLKADQRGLDTDFDGGATPVEPAVRSGQQRVRLRTSPGRLDVGGVTGGKSREAPH